MPLRRPLTVAVLRRRRAPTSVTSPTGLLILRRSTQISEKLRQPPNLQPQSPTTLLDLWRPVYSLTGTLHTPATLRSASVCVLGSLSAKPSEFRHSLALVSISNDLCWLLHQTTLIYESLASPVISSNSGFATTVFFQLGLHLLSVSAPAIRGQMGCCATSCVAIFGIALALFHRSKCPPRGARPVLQL